MSTTTTTTTSPPTTPSKPLTLLIGLSGPSSSGKTTIARLLRSLSSFPSSSFPNNSPSETPHPSLSLFILHQDDFYLTDTSIPLITTTSTSPSGLGSRTLQDWDCVESLDLGLLGRTLGFIAAEGRVPVRSTPTEDGDGEEWGESKEDLNSVGPVDLPSDLIESLRGALQHWWAELISGDASQREIRLCILDGFLLYPNPAQMTNAALKTLHEDVTQKMDLKLLLLASREQTIFRRTRRTGYVTLEGFWEDPEGYVEDVVWPNYARDLGWIMESREGGSVEGAGGGEMVDVDMSLAERERIRVAPGRGEVGLAELLRWAVEEVKTVVEDAVRDETR